MKQESAETSREILDRARQEIDYENMDRQGLRSPPMSWYRSFDPDNGVALTWPYGVKSADAAADFMLFMQAEIEGEARWISVIFAPEHLSVDDEGAVLSHGYVEQAREVWAHPDYFRAVDAARYQVN